MTLKPKITGYNIHVECDVNRYSDGDLPILLVRSRDLAQAIIDLACFSEGLGAIVVIERFIGTDGRTQEIVPQDKSLAMRCTAFRLGLAPNPNFTAVLNLVLREPPLFMALNDLILAITIPHHAPVNCGRAIDGIRNMISQDPDKAKSWDAMRGYLNLSKDYIKLITETSIGPRHGDRTYIPGSSTSEVIQRSWVVMNRFFEFRKRGNQPLPLTEFPLLI